MLPKLKLSFASIAILFHLYSCTTSKKIDRKLLQGYWANVNNGWSDILYPDIILTEKDYILVLDPLDTSSNISMSYLLKKQKITLLTHHQWISKSDIIKLTAESLVFKRRGDNKTFKFYRKKQ